MSNKTLLICAKIQEAQLLQRDRTMLHVIDYFAKSFKFIRNEFLE